MTHQKKIMSPAGVITWLCAGAVLISTAFNQYSICAPELMHEVQNVPDTYQEPHAAARLQECISRRKTALKAASVETEELCPPDGESAAYASRPAIAVSAVVSDGRKKFASIILEGQLKTQIVRPGDEAGGIKIVEIEPEGIMCQWRGLKFFVPLM